MEHYTPSKEEVLRTLKRYWKTDKFECIAEFHSKNQNNNNGIPIGHFNKVRLKDSGHFLVYPSLDGRKFNREVSFNYLKSKGLVDGKEYKIELVPDDNNARKMNPYKMRIEKVLELNSFGNATIQKGNDSPKAFIEYLFYKRGENPEDAATIASQLKLNELELYTHTIRFIFELIQNADDAALNNHPVDIKIYLIDKFLLFIHNGKAFDKEDVQAIANAAKSTKDQNLLQTGYKGIGFKSVFTDSIRVFIKSGEYSFKFDRTAEVYKDFWKLYEKYYNTKNKKAKLDFREEIKGKEDYYTDLSHIPWQIKPIWVDTQSYPNVIREPFGLSNPVSIALEIPKDTLESKNYTGILNRLINEPRFLLFLRNTKGLLFKENEKDSETLEVIKNGDGIFKIQRNGNSETSYLRSDFSIAINNDKFLETGFHFKREEVNTGKFKFFDFDGRELSNVPEKLSKLNSTTLSFAAKLDNSEIKGLNSDETILFNYLPTSDDKFCFPFLVNADFISKTDRESILVENIWNQYLLYHIGYFTTSWIAEIAERIVRTSQGEQEFLARSYLSLLPKNLLDENNKDRESINKSFNRGMVRGLSSQRFILDSDWALKSCNEIIIDETEISDILGVDFFKHLLGHEKYLPNKNIDRNILKRRYLNIDIVTGPILKDNLSNSGNRDLVMEVIKSLNNGNYVDLLKWLDKFCGEYYKEDHLWIIELPFVKVGNRIYNIKEVLDLKNILFNWSGVREVEEILVKSGFSITPFLLDDYSSLFDITKSNFNSYLNDDLNLFKHISENGKFKDLLPSEKNSLINFLKDLHQVGETRYAGELCLFASESEPENLRPLNQFISNSVADHPVWLNLFFIKQDEETALDEDLRMHLIHEDELLKRFFCIKELFQDLIEKVKESDIPEFYKFINDLSNDTDLTDLNFTDIPWLYCTDDHSFHLPNEIYCPGSLIRLNEEGYDAVKLVTEKITSERLAIFESLFMVERFSLGCKQKRISELISEEGVFEVTTINKFLDWAEDNKEEGLLTILKFSKDEDGKFHVTGTEDIKPFFTDNEELIRVTEGNKESSNVLILFPTELYTEKRSNIGLLEGNSLLSYLVENGFSKVEFTNFIFHTQDERLKRTFIEKIATIELESNQPYPKESSVSNLFILISAYGAQDEKYYEPIKEKISIDGRKLSTTNISDKVMITVPKPNGKKYEFNLKELLPGIYNEGTLSITTIIENFTGITDKNELRKIFKVDIIYPEKLFTKFSTHQITYIPPVQMLFLLLYKELYPNADIKRDKRDFSEYLFEGNRGQYVETSREFLELCFKKGYAGFTHNFSFKDFNPKEKIEDKSWATEEEKVPDWVTEWVGSDKNIERIKFLEDAGLQGNESPIVQLRRGLVTKHWEEFSKGLINTGNGLFLENTFKWIYEYQQAHDFNLEKDYIIELLKKRERLGFSIAYLPVVKNIEATNYKIIKYSKERKYFVFDKTWDEYKKEIFESIENKGYYLIDDIYSGMMVDQLTILRPELETLLNSDLIKDQSVEWNTPYYLSWKLRKDCTIKIYNGQEIPYIVKYGEIFEKEISEGKTSFKNSICYVTKDYESSLPGSLKGVLPEDIFNSLIAASREHEEKERINLQHANYTEEENETLKRLFGDNVPEDFQKDLNLVALIKGLNYLDKNGFNVSEAEHELKNTHDYSNLYPVYPKDYNGDTTKARKYMCRSAKSGLLYIRMSSWQSLEKENTFLYVLTGNEFNKCKVYSSKNEVIKDENADYGVLRFEISDNQNDFDKIISGTFDATKLWMILRMKDKKEYKSIFEEIKKEQKKNSTTTAAIGDESID